MKPRDEQANCLTQQPSIDVVIVSGMQLTIA